MDIERRLPRVPDRAAAGRAPRGLRLALIAACALATAVPARGQVGGEGEGRPAAPVTGAATPASGAADRDLSMLSLEDLLELEVESVSLRHETVARAPGVLTVLSWRELRAYQYSSIADALRVVPDVDVLDDLSSYNVGVRGVNAGWGAQSKVFKLMLDGQDVGFRPTAGGFLGPEALPLLAVRRVEVIRGPLSALYGANAFLGVVNVVPQSARAMGEERRGHAIVRGSYLNLWGNSGGAGEVAQWWRDRRWDVFGAVSARGARRDGLRLPRSSPRYGDIEASGASLTTRDDHARAGSAYLKGELDLARAGRLRLDGLFQYSDRTGHFEPDSEPLRGARLTFYNAMARFNYELTPREPLTLRASAALTTGAPTDKQRLYDPFRASTQYLQRDYGYVQGNGALSASYSAPALGSVTAGVDLSVDRERLPALRAVERSGQARVVGAGRVRDFVNVGLFVQGTLELLRPLTALVGARYEHHSYYGDQLSYRGALVYAFAADASLKALVSSAFQAPSPLLLLGGEHPRLTGIEPNDQLRPQRVHAGELALTTRLWEALRLQVSGYVSRINDFAELDTVAARPQAQNRSRIDAVGGSAQVDLRPAALPLSAFANVSLVRTRVATSEPVTLQVSRQTRLFPAFKANVGVSYIVARAYLRPFAVFRWVGERFADKSNLVFLPAGQQVEYALDAYGLVDLGLASSGLRWPGLGETTLSVKVTNAFGQGYAQPGYAGIDVPGRRRQVFVSVEQEL